MKPAASLCLALFVAVCGAADPRCDQQQVAGGGVGAGSVVMGAWGGQHISLVIATDSTATLEYDCAHGTVDEPMRRDAKGNFEARGTHTPEHGGAVSAKEHPQTFDARYIGWADSADLTLTVVLIQKSDTVGTYHLRHGREPSVFKCR